MSKKRIIIIPLAGLVSFAGAFVFAWLTNPSPVSGPDQPDHATLAGEETGPKLPQPEAGATAGVGATSGVLKQAMTEQQLKNLVDDLREKMHTYDNKLQSLEVWERRLQAAQVVLRNDIENLNSLRIELASIIANLKSEREKLLKSRLEIDQTEKLNLQSIAAAYDKMDASSAGKILTSMCAAADPNQAQGSRGGSFDDAVKILHYMSERAEAKLLAEIATSEPVLAAALCEKLKQIVEVD